MFNNIPPITRNIIIINIIVYIVSNLIFSNELYFYLSAYYPFSPYFKSWQVITHMFMHAPMVGQGIGLTHILFNMFTLFSFGPVLEQSLGEKRYLILYFASGLGAFFLFNLWNFIEYQQVVQGLESIGFNVNNYLANPDAFSFARNDPKTASLIGSLDSIMYGKMYGASGAIFGVVAAFATLYPDAKIGIMFIPIPVKVKYILPIIVIGSVWLGISGNGGGVAHLAHVGGALVGWILARIWRKHLYRFN